MPAVIALPTFFSCAGLRPRTRFRFSVALLISVVFSLPVSAGTVTRLFDHGPDSSAPTDYGVYQGSLFYADAGKLWHIDDIDSNPEQIPLPAPFDISESLSANFTEFDGSLFMTLLRNGSSTASLPDHQDARVFRLDSPDGRPIEVKIIASLPPFLGPQPVTVVGWPARSDLIEHRGDLYFSGFRGYTLNGELQNNQCNTALSALFKITDFDSDAVSVASSLDGCGRSTEPIERPIVASESGLLTASVGYFPRSQFSQESIYLDDINLHTTDFSGNPCFPISDIYNFDPLQMIAFDGYVFFRGVNSLVANPDHPDAGPFSPSVFTGPSACPPGLVQVELYRYDPATQETVVFDMYSVSVEQTEEFSQANTHARFGSSDPRFFTVANDTLYFQASRTDGVISNARTDSELYRLTVGDALPEIIRLNPNSPSLARPSGEFLGRLWLTADTGAGNDLHYFAADNITAVPLGVSASIADTARGFTAFDHRVIFNAQGEDGHWGTYAASIEDPAPDNPKNPKQPKSPNGPDPQPGPSKGGLKSSLSINGGRYSQSPGLTESTGSRLSVRCDITNRSSRTIHSARISLTERKRGRTGRTIRQRLGLCQRETLAPGETVSCRRKTTIRRGNRRLLCTTTAKTATGTRLITRDVAFARGQQSR